MDSLPTERDATVVPEPGRWECFKWAWKHSTAGTLLDAAVMAVLTISIAAAVLDLPGVRGEATSVLLGVGALFVLVAVDFTLKLSRAKYELVKLWAQGEVADANRRFVDAAKTRDDAVSRNVELLRELAGS